jgi:hypothetical protein
MKLGSLICALAITLMVAAAHAGTQVDKTSKLSLTVPDGWRLDVKDAGLIGESKDKEVAVLAWSVDPGDVSAMEKKVEGELYSMIANLKWDQPTTGKTHAMAATYFRGTGHAKGGDVVVNTALIGPGKAKKSLLIALVVKVDRLDAHKAELQKIFDSVQAAK